MMYVASAENSSGLYVAYHAIGTRSTRCLLFSGDALQQKSTLKPPLILVLFRSGDSSLTNPCKKHGRGGRPISSNGWKIADGDGDGDDMYLRFTCMIYLLIALRVLLLCLLLCLSYKWQFGSETHKSPYIINFQSFSKHFNI